MNNMANTRQNKIIYGWLLFLISFSTASLVFWMSYKFEYIFDMTQNNMRSLSPASVTLLNQIEGPVKVTAYAREDPQLRAAIIQFIEGYQAIKPDVLLEFINIDSAPDEVRELGVRINGELVLEYQDRTEHVRYADERTLINAMARISQDSQAWIAYLSGHGERDMLGRANHDLGAFGFRLQERGYNIQPVNLSEVPEIPDNTSVLIIAGPRIPLQAQETEKLLTYLQKGKSLLWLVDPGDMQFIPAELPAFLGIEIAEGTVIDTASELLGIDDPTITVITESLYTQHPLLTNFSYTTIYPHAAALLPTDSTTWTSSPILMSGNQAWVETSELDNEVSLDPASDLQGPLTLGIAQSRETVSDNASASTDRQQRIIVIGDGDFLTNTYLENSGNLELGMRVISWLSHRDNLIEIPTRTVSDKTLTVPRYYIGAAGIFFLVVLPLISVSIAAALWRQRRQT